MSFPPQSLDREVAEPPSTRSPPLASSSSPTGGQESQRTQLIFLAAVFADLEENVSVGLEERGLEFIGDVCFREGKDEYLKGNNSISMKLKIKNIIFIKTMHVTQHIPSIA